MRGLGGWPRGWGRTRFVRTATNDIVGARMACAAFFVGGAVGYAADYVTATSDRGSALMAMIAVVGGAIGMLAPWQRWPRRAQLIVPTFALALVAVSAVVGTEADVQRFLAAVPLLFVFIGLTQPLGTALAFAPAAIVALVAAEGFGDANLAQLLWFIPVSVLVGEAIAHAQRQRDQAHDNIAGLLHAVRVLARVTEERTGAQLVASLSAHLLDADAVAVFVADRPQSGRYLNRAWFGHPALADAAPLVIDTRRDASFATHSTRFFRDAADVPLLQSGATGRMRSAALIWLPGEGDVPVGVVLAMWGSARRSLPTAARQSSELVSEEAGRMFLRLRTTAALAHDARTDPLTELSNRRTFAHALSRLRPGDAVVIVDLDHFKAVNDRFGHEAGDEVLRSLARCLRVSAREVDCVARYGGEEFALVLPEAEGGGALRLLTRVRRAWEALDPIASFSAGIAVHEAGERASSTLRRADAALYQAKEAGRDRDVLAPRREIVLDDESPVTAPVGTPGTSN